MHDECFSEASPASPASAASTASPLSSQSQFSTALISWTRLNLAGYINRPSSASARIPQPDLVKTTSPGLTFPSTAHSDLIETTSLGCPVGPLNKNWHVTDPLREASSASVIAVRVQAPLRPLHALHYLTSHWMWGQKRQKPLQPPAFHGRTALQ